MQIPRHIFKKYDIRGLVEKEITPELSENIGKAFATLLSREIKGALTIAVGRDMRETSPLYQERLIKGLVELGVKVLDIGLVSTPAFYFGVSHTKADGGVMVSASHNPAEYNGFKLTRARAVPVSGDSGIEEVADFIEQESFSEFRDGGSVELVKDIPRLATEAELDFAGGDFIKEFKIVIDTANGMGAQYFDELLKKKNLQVEKMFWELDGTFPNHEADPFKPTNTEAIRKRVQEVGADLGITTDGDGDRIFFITNEGEMVEPAIIRGILSQRVLQDYPGATVCYDIRPGKITLDMIEEAGGKPCITRVGHSLIKEEMKKQNAVFGGESSGHFFYAFPAGMFEGPVTATMQILQELTSQNKTLSELVKPLRKYSHSGEINFLVEDKDEMISKIKSTYTDGDLNELDGITITYQDFWFNVRASNTESKLRLNLEAVDDDTMEKRRDEIIKIIEG